MDALETSRAEVTAAAQAYCRALYASDTGALERLFHPSSHLYGSQDGQLIEWPRAQFLERVASREPGPGEAPFAIESVDLAGPEMAHVRLSVAIPGRRFTDYLNFLKLDGEWRVIAKIFRVAEGPGV